MRRTSLAGLLLLAAVSASAAITGTIVGDDGAPVAGARVRAYAREPLSATAARLFSSTPDATPLATAESAANGSFSVDAKGNATADVVVDAAGHEPAAFTGADGDDAGAIVLHAAGTHPYRVTADGKPLANALVHLGRALVVRSDAQGMIPFAVTGDQLFAIHPDYAVTRGSDRRRDVALTRGTAVSGRVVGRDGATPVAGAVVAIGGWPLARSGEDGTFTIAHAPLAHSIVAMTATDAGAAAMATKPLTIRLGTAATLSGGVLSSKGDTPVAGARVTITSSDSELSALTDARGRYSIAGVPPGTYAAIVHHPRYTTARVPEIRIASQPATQSFIIAPRSHVRGTVIGEDRKPVPSALVSVVAVLIGAGGGATVATGAEGEFTLTLPAGGMPLTLVAAKNGYASTLFGPLTLEGGETKSGVTLTLRRGFPMRFRVVDGEKQPVAGVTVDVAPTGSSPLTNLAIPCSLTERERCRTTSADGTYDIRLAEGRYDITVGGDLVPLVLPAQELSARVSPMTLTVDRGVDVAGRVSFSDGTPVANARVLMRGGSGNTATTDANGAFVLHRMPRSAVTLYVMTADEPSLSSAPVDVTPPARDVSIVLPAPARIEGRVVDRATSQPVTQFTVMPTQKNVISMQMRGVSFDNADGSFVLKRVMPGSIELRVSAPGYVLGNVADLTVEEGKTLSGIEVKLDRGARVHGRVSASGKPVAGAAVRIATRGDRVVAQPVQSDADGNYTLDAVAAGEQTVDVQKQGFITKRKSIEVAAGKDVTLDVELDRGREMRGRVNDRSGQPVGGARVLASTPGAPFASGATTDPDGEFVLSGLEDGHYRVAAQKSGYVTATLDDVEVPSARALLLTLDRGGTISGRVTGLPENEIGQVRVSAQNSSANEPVDATGRFTLTGIPDGHITVSAFKAGAHARQSAPQTVEVVNGSAPFVEIDFSSGISVHGRVTRNGAPANNGNVFFIPRGGGGTQRVAMIGGDGMYEVSGLETGEYDVRVNNSGSTDTLRYTVTGSAAFDIDLHGAALRGVVLDAGTGAPIADARVYVAPGRDSRVIRNAYSDSNGRFLIDSMPDGTVELHAEREHYAAAVQSVVISGGAATPVELRLTAGQEAVIRIVDAATGAALQGTVALLDAGRKMVANGAGRSEDGATHVWVAAGRYTAQVWVPGYVMQMVDVVVPGPEVRVVMSKTARLVLTSRTGGTFRVRRPNAAPTDVAFPLAAGQTRTFEGQPPGAYQIDKLGADLKTVLRSYSITLVEGQTATVEAE